MIKLTVWYPVSTWYCNNSGQVVCVYVPLLPSSIIWYWWKLGIVKVKVEVVKVEGSRPRGRPNRTWKEVVRQDCQARKLNKENAVDRCKWRKVIKEVRWPGWVWAGECFFWYRPTRVFPDKRPLNGCCCCCCCWKLGINRHTTWYTGSLSMVWQHKLMSGCF